MKVKILYFCCIFFILNNLESLACQERARSSSVKANMHTLQTMIETYAANWKGIYPKNIEELKKEAIKKAYWKMGKNPYSFKDTLLLTENLNEQNLDFNFVKNNNYSEGTIFYTPFFNKNSPFISTYKIYGIVKTNLNQNSIKTYLNDFLNYINIFSYSICGHNRVDYFSEEENDFAKEKGKIYSLTNQ